MRLFVQDHWNGWLYVVDARKIGVVPIDVECRRIADVGEIAGSAYEEIRRQAWQPEPDTFPFGAWSNGELAAVCWFQAGETHRRRGGLIRLADDEAELAQITTASVFRGRGVACQLIRHAVIEMSRAGYRQLYAKIWHDNVASIRAFERAGWQRQCRFLSIQWRYASRPMVIRLPQRRQRASPAARP